MELLSSERKAKLKEKRDYTCECCKIRCIESDLEIHHIDKDRSNNRLSNLEVLCRWCHDKKHPIRPQK